MSRHTPGPWTVADGSRPLITGDCLLRRQIWSKGPRIAFCEEQNVGGTVAEANARLIAAAPDLYAAAMDAVDLIELWKDALHRITGAVWEGDPPSLIALRAAITKAEGQ